MANEKETKLNDIEANQMEIIRRLMELKDLLTNPDGSLKSKLKGK